MDRKEAVTSDFQQKEELHRYEAERLNTAKLPIDKAMQLVLEGYSK